MRRWLGTLALLAVAVGVAAAAGGAGRTPASPPIGVSPAKTAFGRTAIGLTSTYVSITFTNNTTEAVTQSGMGNSWDTIQYWGPFNAADYAPCAVVLQPGDSCTLSVYFLPSERGRVAGQLWLGFRGSVYPFNEYSGSFSVTGNGYQPKQ